MWLVVVKAAVLVTVLVVAFIALLLAVGACGPAARAGGLCASNVWSLSCASPLRSLRTCQQSLAVFCIDRRIASSNSHAF